MALTECANGHLYDTDMNESCPYCNGGSNMINFSADSGTNFGRTAPVGGGFGPSGTKQSQSEIGATVAPAAYVKKQEEDNRTVGIFQKRMEIEPIVGWLVCVDGADKGKDYKLYGKNNTIGRSERMDVYIKNDPTISRENHARLAYDQKHNNFHLIPADATNNIYVNDEPIYLPTLLRAYDLIELGDTKVVFIPFCSDRFTWQNGLKQGE